MRFAALLLLVGCGGPIVEAFDAGTRVDAGIEVDAGVVDKAAHCASVFGSGLPASFGRFDGVVTAVVRPADKQCALPNSDHVVVQVAADGGIYRMVVNVKSDFGDPDVRFAAIRAPLIGGAWSDGWHPGLTLDYPGQLMVHTDAGFTPTPMAQLIERVAAEITVGDRISVFADSSGGMYSNSTHKIHRNGNMRDGALVLDPDAALPRWLLFHFANQNF